MARHLFGMSPADFALERVGDELKLRPGAIGTVWDSMTGGTQLTDLLDLDSAPITVVTATAESMVGFYGPDGITSLWVDFGYGRFILVATDIGSVVQTTLDQFEAPGKYPTPSFWKVFGHSYVGTASFGQKSNDHRPDVMLRNALGIHPDNMINYANAGARLIFEGVTQGGWAKIINNVRGSLSNFPYVSPEGGAILCYGINDLGFSTDTSQNREAFRHVLRAMISRCRIAMVRENNYTAGAGTGTTVLSGYGEENNAAYEWASGTSAHWSMVAGSTITITLPTDYDGSPVSIAFIAQAGTSGALFTFTGTAGITGTLDTSDLQPSAALTHSYLVKRITTLTPAAAGQTIIVTATTIAGIALFDGWWIEASTPPPVIVCNIAKLTTAGYAMYGTPPNDSQVAAWNTVITDVASEFDLMVQVADLDGKLDKDNHPEVFSDGLHPNDLGSGLVADAIREAVQRLRPTNPVRGSSSYLAGASRRHVTTARPMVDGMWYTAETASGPNGNNYTPVAGDVHALPFMITESRISTVRWCVELVTSTVATSVAFAIYEDRERTGYPQWPYQGTIVTASPLALSTGAGVKLSPTSGNGSISMMFEPGLYWLVLKITTAGTTTMRTVAGQSPYMPTLSSAGAGGVVNCGWKLSGQGTGAMNTNRFPSGAILVNNAPYVGLQITHS